MTTNPFPFKLEDSLFETGTRPPTERRILLKVHTLFRDHKVVDKMSPAEYRQKLKSSQNK